MTTTTRSTIRTIAFLGAVGLVTLALLGGIVGFVLTRDDASSSAAGGTEAAATSAAGTARDAAPVEAPSPVVEISTPASQPSSASATPAPTSTAGESAPHSTPASDAGTAAPSAGSSPVAPRVTLPTGAFPVLPIDVLGPEFTGPIAFWCTPTFRMEAPISDPAGVSLVWASYKVGGSPRFVAFERIDGRNAWTTTGVPSPSPLPVTDIVIHARDALGNNSQVSIGSACVS